MVPAALIVLFVAAGVAFWGLSVEGRLSALAKKNAKQDKEHERLRQFFEDVVVGHVNEPRLRAALSRIFDKEE